MIVFFGYLAAVHKNGVSQVLPLYEMLNSLCILIVGIDSDNGESVGFMF